VWTNKHYFLLKPYLGYTVSSYQSSRNTDLESDIDFDVLDM